jgi:hypothetical protein
VIHDPVLVDHLSKLRARPFEAEVYRATGPSVDPLAPSINGGRWAPPPDRDPGISLLYTSCSREGALAELSSFLVGLTPVPKGKLVKLSRIAVTVSRTVTLDRPALERLNIDMNLYGQRDYEKTQEIGAALAFLGFDALLAPSARWSCDNLMVFKSNHGIGERLEVLIEENIEWRKWAAANGIVTDDR